MKVNKKAILNISLTIVFILMTMIFCLSSAILVPAMFRPFYYMQINPLGIPKASGYSYGEIKEAFDDVLDFIWLHKEFKTGVLAYSESGKAHFADCVPLFWLDLILCIVSFISLFTLYLLNKFRVIELRKFNSFHPLFYSGIVLLTLILVLIVWALIDFDSLFKVFHHVFFPGKNNWEFDPNKDEIILILPIEFFISCAAFIGVDVILYTGSAIAYYIINKITTKKAID